MDSDKEGNEKLLTEKQEGAELDKALRKKQTLNRLFGSSSIFLAPEETIHERTDLQGKHIIQNRVKEHLANGKSLMETCQYEKAVNCFSKAITLLPEQTDLHVNQAEAYLQLCDFQSAAASYKRAATLEPAAHRDRLAFIYYMQGQCLFDRGSFLEALQAFSKAAEMKPGYRPYEAKSLACLTAAGHHDDCVKLVNEWMMSDGPNADLYVLRARMNKATNQTSRCYSDVQAALALSPSCTEAQSLLQQLHEASEAARQRAVDCALRGNLPEALCMINISLENSPQDPRLYLFRGIVYRRLKDFTASLEDLVRAVELNESESVCVSQGESVCVSEGQSVCVSQGESVCVSEGQSVCVSEGQSVCVSEGESVCVKEGESMCVTEESNYQLVLTYNDFAVHCFGGGFFAEATLLLNKAIDEEKNQAGLYLNRGDCFFRQGEWCFALADYQQAEEMCRPDDASVRLRLAVLHNTLGTFCFQDGCVQMAVEMFSLAVHYNPSVSGYYENRAKAYRRLNNLQAARKDFICMIILDPNSQELPPMMMSLFPGLSVCDVLKIPAAECVRDQLSRTIQAASSSHSEQHSLSEKLQAMTLTNENAVSRSHDPESEAGSELKLCVNQLEVHDIVKSILQKHLKGAV